MPSSYASHTSRRAVSAGNAFERNPLATFLSHSHSNHYGIGRQYILATNADIILSQELIDALGSSPPRLSPDAYYRIDRHDLAAPVPLHFGERALNGRVQDLLEWCRRNVSAVQVDTRICSARGALYK